MTTCKCYSGSLNAADFVRTDLGEDALGEASLQTCKTCGAKWLNYLVEEPAFTASGRWWFAPVADAAGLTAANAKDFIERQPWCFRGGSYYDGDVKRIEQPIKVH